VVQLYLYLFLRIVILHCVKDRVNTFKRTEADLLRIVPFYYNFLRPSKLHPKDRDNIMTIVFLPVGVARVFICCIAVCEIHVRTSIPKCCIC
jgi:hypothetical protein